MKVFRSWRAVPIAIYFACAAQASVVSVSSVGGLGVSSTFDMGLFGAVNSTFLTPHTASGLTAGGATVDVLAATPIAVLAISQQAPTGSWSGHYPDATLILNNQFTGDVSFTFSGGIYGFGASLDDAFGGNFTGGYIQAYSDTARTQSLGQFALSSGTGLIFAGVLSTNPDILAITLHDNSNYFATGPLSLVESAPTPEPVSAVLVLAGLSGAVFLRRRRTQ